MDELQTRYEHSCFSMVYKNELLKCYKKDSTIYSGENFKTNILCFQQVRPRNTSYKRVTKMLQTKIKAFRIGDSRTRYHCFQLLLVPTKIQYPKNHFPETLLNFSLILHLSTPRLAEKLLIKSDSNESSL